MKSIACLIDWSAEGVAEKKMQKTVAQIWKSDTRTCMKITCEPGWKWSECIGPNMPGNPDKCPGHHFGYLQSGTFLMKHEDGSEVTASAGQCYECKPGHTAEVIGDEPVVMIEFSQQVEALVKDIKEVETPAAAEASK